MLLLVLSSVVLMLSWEMVSAKPIGNMVMFGIIMAIIIGVALLFLLFAIAWWLLNGCNNGRVRVEAENLVAAPSKYTIPGTPTHNHDHHHNPKPNRNVNGQDVLDELDGSGAHLVASHEIVREKPSKKATTLKNDYTKSDHHHSPPPSDKQVVLGQVDVENPGQNESDMLDQYLNNFLNDQI
jgi:hypothetical protein